MHPIEIYKIKVLLTDGTAEVRVPGLPDRWRWPSGLRWWPTFLLDRKKKKISIDHYSTQINNIIVYIMPRGEHATQQLYKKVGIISVSLYSHTVRNYAAIRVYCVRCRVWHSVLLNLLLLIQIGIHRQGILPQYRPHTQSFVPIGSVHILYNADGVGWV